MALAVVGVAGDELVVFVYLAQAAGGVVGEAAMAVAVGSGVAGVVVGSGFRAGLLQAVAVGFDVLGGGGAVAGEGGAVAVAVVAVLVVVLRIVVADESVEFVVIVGVAGVVRVCSAVGDVAGVVVAVVAGFIRGGLRCAGGSGRLEEQGFQDAQINEVGVGASLVGQQ